MRLGTTEPPPSPRLWVLVPGARRSPGPFRLGAGAPGRPFQPRACRDGLPGPKARSPAVGRRACCGARVRLGALGGGPGAPESPAGRAAKHSVLAPHGPGLRDGMRGAGAAVCAGTVLCARPSVVGAQGGLAEGPGCRNGGRMSVTYASPWGQHIHAARAVSGSVPVQRKPFR